MKSIVIRSAAVFTAVALAVVGLFSVANVQDGDNPYNPTTPTEGSTALVYDGPYATPAQPIGNGALGFGGVDAAAGTASTDDEGVGGTGGGLAVTGNSAELPAAVAIGLLAAGGTAVVGARKRETS